LVTVAAQLAVAKKEWKAASRAFSEQGWRKLVGRIEAAPGRVAFKIWRRSIPSGYRPHSITLSRNGDVPRSLQEGLNNFGFFYSVVMSLADLPNWREGVADPDLHSAPPSDVDEAVSADLGHGIHLFRSPIDHDFSIDELQAAVKSMRASTAPGPDSISVPLLSHAGPAVFEALLNIFNSSWQFAIFKKGDQSDPSSYRLISIRADGSLQVGGAPLGFPFQESSGIQEATLHSRQHLQTAQGCSLSIA
jgi:hypothetical protein